MNSRVNSKLELNEKLYLQDSGELPFEARRVLVQLLSGPSIEARRHSKLWPILLQHEAVIRSRFSDMFLDLIIDKEQEVAFLRQAEVGELDAPTLLRSAPLTLIDSELLIFLRAQLTREEGKGERAALSEEDIQQHMKVYQQSGSVDHAGFNKKISASIEKFKKYSILRKIKGSEDRFEISPVLKLLFSADEIQQLDSLYQELKAKGDVGEIQEVEEEET